jgi:hypothetical protein
VFRYVGVKTFEDYFHENDFDELSREK